MSLGSHLKAFLALSCIIPTSFCDEIVTSDEPYTLPAIPHLERVAFFQSFQTKKNSEAPVDIADDLGWIVSSHEDYKKQEILVSDEFQVNKGDDALILKQKHARYGFSKKLDKPFSLDREQVTIQFEAKFNKGWTCSGAYLKFVGEIPGENSEQANFQESTPYVLMFGPDKCGGTNKIHVIFRHQNPVSGEWEEKHLAKTIKNTQDEFSHLYTLQLKKSDQSVRVLLDREEQALLKATKKGSFKPNFVPDEEIDDPEDSKPETWVDDKRIPDPEAKKPENWVDDPALEYIVDPDAKKPDDWDDEEDGPWEAPQIKNPAYDGKWEPDLIENPDYIGEWKPKKIPNPNYFTQEAPLSNLPAINYVFVEVLTNDEAIQFDNILITEDYEVGKFLADEVFSPKQAKEKSMEQEQRLSDNKEERRRNLSENFGFYSVVEFVAGEIAEFYELHTYIFIGGLVSLFVFGFYKVFIKGDFFTLTEEEIKEAATHALLEKRKKEDAAKKAKEAAESKDTSEEKGTEEKVSPKQNAQGESSMRRRPKRAD